MSGELDKHPTSGALLLDPSRRISRCASCCGETCLYAIRAEPCFQEVDEDCNDLIPSLWFCVESKCFEAEQDFSQIKTPVTFLYTAPDDVERCWQTVPDSIVLVSELSAEIQAALITDTALECIEEGCSGAPCGEPDPVCDCVCRSTVLGETDCCMSRWDNSTGPAPWTFTYRRTIKSSVHRTSHNGGSIFTSCPDTDCIANAECVWFFYEEEVDEASITTPILEQGCTKNVPLRSRITIDKTALIGPFEYPCCSAENDPSDWTSAGSLSVPPPATVPYAYTDVDTGEVPATPPCYSRIREQSTTEGDCTFYRYELIEESWSSQDEDGECVCQELQRTITTVEYAFFAATDEATVRRCAQCALE